MIYGYPFTTETFCTHRISRESDLNYNDVAEIEILSDTEFSGNLPDQCPPATAVICFKGTLMRLVANDPPTVGDFLSQCDEGNKKPASVSECQFRGVSYFSTGSPAYRKTLERYSQFDRLKKAGKDKIAYIYVNGQSGMIDSAIPSKNGHVCLWRTESYLPQMNVQKVEVIQ